RTLRAHAVSLRLRVDRSMSRMPSCASRSATRRLTADVGIFRRRRASEKLLASTTLAKIISEFRPAIVFSAARVSAPDRATPHGVSLRAIASSKNGKMSAQAPHRGRLARAALRGTIPNSENTFAVYGTRRSDWGGRYSDSSRMPSTDTARMTRRVPPRVGVDRNGYCDHRARKHRYTGLAELDGGLSAGDRRRSRPYEGNGIGQRIGRQGACAFAGGRCRDRRHHHLRRLLRREQGAPRAVSRLVGRLDRRRRSVKPYRSRRLWGIQEAHPPR